MNNKDLINITKEHYDNKENDAFYFDIWGGENIHIGFYKKPEDSIKEASRNTVWTMVRKLKPIKKNQRILDIGAGYGGAARLLAEKYGCKIDCLNLSEVENERNRKMNKDAELEELVSVTDGNFEKLPFERETFDLVWSQDALLHSNKKEKVFREVARVLKPEGRFIFTDLMQTEDCPKNALKEVLAPLSLKKLGSIKLYEKLARKADLERVIIAKRPAQLINHYKKVLEALDEQHTTIVKKLNEEFVDKMRTNVQLWIDAGEKEYVTWGILQFQKRNI